MARSKTNLNFLFILLVPVLFWGNVQSQETEILTLDDCIKMALESNSDLTITRYMDKAAGENVLGSYEGILPTISASANKGKVETGPSEYLSNEPVGYDEDGNVIYEQRVRKTQKQFRESSSASVTLSQNLFDGGIWWNNIRKARADKEASEYDLISQRNNVILLVQQAYFDLNKQKKLFEVNELAVARSQAQLDRIEKMYELGATAQLDVFQARVTLGNDRITLLTQKNIYDQSKKNLNLAMGRDPVTPILTTFDLKLSPDLPEIEALIDEAYRNQPLIKKTEADIRSSKLSVSMAKGMNYPRLSVYVNYDRFHENLDKVFSDYGQNYQARYGINLSMSLFNGFSDYVNIQKAEINRKMSQETFEDYKRNLASAVHQYYEDYKSYLDIIAINKQNLEAANEEVRLAEERYQIGAGTFLEVREAQVNLTRAEQTLIAAQYNARIVLAQLDNALGTSFANYNENGSQD